MSKPWSRKPRDGFPFPEEDLFECNNWYPWFNFCKGAYIAIPSKLEGSKVYKYMNDDEDRGDAQHIPFCD